MSGASIGIMDPAYFVGRKEILTWLNETFSLSLSKIEQTCSGAVACQLLDAIYPGQVPMSKVKWDAKSDFEYIHNYKILQRVFDKKDIEKHIEVQKLIRGKYQDNLEFMQWFKSFYDKNHSGSADYDPTARRRAGKGGSSFGSGGSAANRKPAAGRGERGSKPAAAAGRAPARAEPASAPRRGPRAGGRPSATAGADSKRVEALDAQVAELKLSVEGLEKERDFYFGKLRDIEILLQAYKGSDPDIAKQIFTILYATEEDFVIVDEEGAADKENSEVVAAE